jgi:hypothetical protein
MSRRSLTLVLALVGALVLPVSAQASIKIAGRAHDASLRVNAKGYATISWTTSRGARRSAVVAPSCKTTWDRAASGKDVTHESDEVKLPVLVELRQGPSDRFFALQSWRRLKDGPVELRFSRWFGNPTKLPIRAVCCKWGSEMVKGRATFHGKPIYGYSNTPEGVPLDKYGRNVYIDFMKGGKWHRAMGILTHRPTGRFSLWIRPYWRGSSYRARMIGPNWGRTLAPDAQGWTKSAL